MRHLAGSPISFLVTGFAWLLLGSLLGFAILIGLVRGTPLPSWLKLIHAHGVLIGGLLQLMIGGLLAWHSSQENQSSDGRPKLFATMNGALIGLLAAFAIQDLRLAGVAGVVITAAVFSVAGTAWRQGIPGPGMSADHLWLPRLSLLTLFGGFAVAIVMALGLVPEYFAHARLLHLHLILLGFVTVTLVGLLNRLLPIVLKTSLYSPFLARLTMWIIPSGFAVLLGGFVTSSLRLELAVGALLVIGTGLYAYNLFRTWIHSGQSGSAASDHLLLAAFFLILTMVLGVLVGVNFLPEQPVLPIGSLHLAAYTHMAMLGFVLHFLCGASSYGVPALLSDCLVPNQKKREPFRERLDAMMNRWRIVQLTGFSLGTMGLGVVAGLTWNFPLSSPYIQAATWVTVALLLAGFTIFTAKLAWVFGAKPTE